MVHLPDETLWIYLKWWLGWLDSTMGEGTLYNVDLEGEENLLKAVCDNYIDSYSQTHTN